MEGRIYSNVGGGILSLEMPLHHQTTQTKHNQTLQKHPQIMMSNTNHPTPQGQQTQIQISMKPSNQRNKDQNHSTNNGEDDLGHNNNNKEDVSLIETTNSNRSSSSSPWQRMKWTDNMVRLLIMVVYYIGDEVGFDHHGKPNVQFGNSGNSGCNNFGGIILQKKGKWKSVSKALMEKGFYVSPQQCEDKFNDLNKRYKRVNDILGRGNACKVVENQSLLDTMDILPKLKEEVRKLLNSKHLFFKEMCAYHRSCGHDTGNVTIAHHQTSNPQEQGCHHSSLVPTAIPLPNSTLPTNPEPDDQDEQSKSHDEDDEEDEFEDEEEEEHEEERSSKRARTTMGGTSISSNPTLQRLNSQVMSVLQDGSKSPWEKKSWVMTQLIELEEKGVNFKYQEMELEKQRQKWMRFSSKKEREMEKMKVENMKNRLEIEKMMIFLRKKELVLFATQHQQCSS